MWCPRGCPVRIMGLWAAKVGVPLGDPAALVRGLERPRGTAHTGSDGARAPRLDGVPSVGVSGEEQRGLTAGPLWPQPSRAPGHGDQRKSPSAGMGTRNGLGPVGEAPRWGRGSLGPSPGATSMEVMVASVGGTPWYPGEAGGGDNTPGDLSVDHPRAHCMRGWGGGREKQVVARREFGQKRGFSFFLFFLN